MKLLNIDPVYRQYLIAKHALRLDADGDEILVGLTASESVEYLAIMDAACYDTSLKIGTDPERFLTLHHRHIGRLPDYPYIFSARRPLSW